MWRRTRRKSGGSASRGRKGERGFKDSGEKGIGAVVGLGWSVGCEVG